MSNIKLEFSHPKDALINYVVNKLRIPQKDIKSLRIYKRSVDARKKPDIYFVYSILFETGRILDEKKLQQNNIQPYVEETYQFPFPKEGLKSRPIIIGTGPAGLFCALVLARNGHRPIILERGDVASVRHQKITESLRTGKIDFKSNIQFGEGGAGTFSDGKLNTGVKDPNFRKQFVLSTLYEHGADESILYINKPHVGTDYLMKIVENMRNEIIELGGDVHFNTLVTDFHIDPMTHAITGVECQTEKGTIHFYSDAVVLAIGHSSRETFSKLLERQVHLEAKPFAIGLRIEHPQTWINKSQYGEKHYLDPRLPVADYKLTYQSSNGRGVYTFCMCPGGYVVNASSHEEGVVCNGMSYFDRGSKNANSAIISTVTIDDYKALLPDEADHPLVGMKYQAYFETCAYNFSQSYSLPTQSFGDYYASYMGKPYTYTKKVPLASEGESIASTCKSTLIESDLKMCLPAYINQSIIEGIQAFGNQIQGFDHPQARLIGIETRTSSPVKIVRNEDFMSNIYGLFPCGEGAGYAGGIMSAAIDGIKTAEKLVAKGLLSIK
jgi:uncharacterized protein